MVNWAARADHSLPTLSSVADSSLNDCVTPESLLPPQFPAGWFSVGFSHEIAPGRSVSRRFMGQEIVVFRTESGRLHALDAYCPHLGAHLGHGGTVEREVLRCPFHGFTFDGSGACTGTPYASGRTPAIRARNWPVCEVAGAVVIYYDPQRRQPAWELVGPEAGGCWRALRTNTWRFRGHPQETSENAIDFGHLTELHGFLRTRVLDRPQLDGPRMSLKWAFTPSLGSWFNKLLSTRAGSILATATVTLEGLGFAMIETTVSPLGLNYRQLVLATPVDAEQIDFRTSVSLRRFAGQDKPSRLLRLLGEACTERLMLVAVSRELERDIAIWRTKSYLPFPQLAPGDGPIGQFRVWSRQFYQLSGRDDDMRMRDLPRQRGVRDD
jgi:nitrite reductase/ring-hydroxylating ferredoxin subunit